MHDVATSSNKAASGMQCQPANTAPLWHGKGHRAGAVEQIDAAAKHIAKIQSLILVPNRSLDQAILSGNFLHTVSGREWLRGCSLCVTFLAQAPPVLEPGFFGRGWCCYPE